MKEGLKTLGIALIMLATPGGCHSPSLFAQSPELLPNWPPLASDQTYMPAKTVGEKPSSSADRVMPIVCRVSIDTAGENQSRNRGKSSRFVGVFAQYKAFGEFKGYPVVAIGFKGSHPIYLARTISGHIANNDTRITMASKDDRTNIIITRNGQISPLLCHESLQASDVKSAVSILRYWISLGYLH